MEENKPKYTRVIEWVQNSIASGELHFGDRLKTENEIGKMFGLSRQTVRRAIGELENRHVLTRVQGSGTYVGSELRQEPRKRYMNIAVISTYIDSYIFPRTLRGFEEVFSENGYATQIAFTNNNIERETAILKNILEKDNIDGLIVEANKSALPNPNIRYYKELKARQIPILFFNTIYPELDMPCVSIDDKDVGKRAVNLLIAAGHTRIGGIFKLDDGQGRLRYEGYCEAIRESNLSVDDRRVFWVDSEDLKYFKGMEEYINFRLKGCTAVLCYNDEVAYQLTEACEKRGIRIPEDLSIVSIDNSDLANLAAVPFTSFPHPMDALGRKGAENLLRLIRDPEFDAGYKFDSQAVIRKSVRDLKAGPYNR